MVNYFEALLRGLDGEAPIDNGTLAERPNPRDPGAVYKATDLSPPEYYVCDGDEWVEMTILASKVGTAANPLGSFSVQDITTDAINTVERIRTSDQLPSPSGGTHTLEDMTAYYFDGFVTSDAALELGDQSPLVATHGGLGGFIYTGGSGAAIRGTDVPFFARDATFGAPNATMFDLSADATTEMLVESCSFSDAAGLGRINSLGTIDGYRVPTFKGCNFEEFDGSLTFDGSPEKIFIADSPFRDVDDSNVTCLTLAGSSSCQIVVFVGNYVKDVQSDTQVWNIESGGEPSEVFQYLDNTHDTSVTKSNVITGPNASKDVEPFIVTGSYPLANTSIIGEMHNDGSSAVTIGTQDTYTLIDATATQGTAKRFEKAVDGRMKYTGVKDLISESTLNLSFYGANGDIYTFGIAKNGTVEAQHSSTVEARGANANVTITVNAVLELAENDELSIQVKNESGTNDPTILSYSFTSLSV